MSFAIRYHRSPEVVKRYAEHGVIKQVGFIVGRDRYTTHYEAEKLAHRITAQNPSSPVTVVPSYDHATVGEFRSITRWDVNYAKASTV